MDIEMSNANRIGSGSWSYCYEQKDGSVVIQSMDFIKKLMSKSGWSKHRMWPKLKCIRLECETEEPLYQMERLDIISKTDEKEIERRLTKRQYKWLGVLRKISYQNGAIDVQKKRLSRIIPKEFHGEMKQIFNSLDYIWSQGGKGNFECQDFNLAIKDNYVVLLDCFFPDGRKSCGDFSNPKEYKFKLK